jgi:polyketide synthase PksJ
MIPSAFVVLQDFPRTPNGKIDKKALLYKNNETIINKKIVKPENEVEEKIYQIWSSVLKSDNFGVEDNFFEIGGNSLLIIQVAGHIKKQLGKEIKVINLFKYPTIRQISNFLLTSENATETIDDYSEDRIKKKRSAISHQKERRLRND